MLRDEATPNKTQMWQISGDDVKQGK